MSGARSRTDKLLQQQQQLSFSTASENDGVLAYSVAEITELLEASIDANPVLCDKFTVRGEISNVKQSARGHVYFTLKDEGASIGGILWASTAARLKFDLEDGLDGYVTGKLEIYRPSGSYSVIGSKIEPVGVGALQLAFQKLKEKLDAEGLFNEEYKKPIPEFPQRIGIVTSRTGAVIHDMIRTIRKKNPLVDILLLQAKVQGEGAAEEIAAAIKELNNPAYKLDVLIVGRGGGSFEDLFCFSEEPVVRAIFNADVPIVTGIGHEPDFGLADAAADYSAATPTMAAEYVTPDMHEIQRELAQKSETLADELEEMILFYEQNLDRNATQFVEYFHGYLNAAQRTMDQNTERLITYSDHYFKKLAQQLQGQASELNAFSPLATLARGYAVAQKDKTLIKSVKQLKPGDSLTIRLEDGSAETKITEIKKNP